METTFITIHDLSPDATILYSSDSIVDILGYHPNEVVNRSCWDFFHPDELPLARERHSRGVQRDRAAVLSYCQMRDRNNQWVGCEAVFTVVYDVLVGCTTIYKAGSKSQNRALEAPIVRRLFSSSPRDPRYHMLSHLSSKFSQSPNLAHEPRAALFLNRYTRTLTIMYATDGLADLLGISGTELRGRSFYFCIAENCLQDAVRCLETAKANDSIAYLRFWYRDPRTDDAHDIQMSTEQTLGPSSSSGYNDTDRNALHDKMEYVNSVEDQSDLTNSSKTSKPAHAKPAGMSKDESADSRTDSESSTNPYSHEAVFGDHSRQSSSSSSSLDSSDEQGDNNSHSSRTPSPIELEAVVSCTSDGLVVCLRKARPMVPGITDSQRSLSTSTSSQDGFFAVPWARNPESSSSLHHAITTSPSNSAPSLSLTGASNVASAPALPQPSLYENYMLSIKECAVFAWGIIGINGTLADHSNGRPRGEAQPPAGLAIWDPTASNQLPENTSEAAYSPVDQLATRNLGHKFSPEDSFGDASRGHGYLQHVNADGPNFTHENMDEHS